MTPCYCFQNRTQNTLNHEYSTWQREEMLSQTEALRSLNTMCAGQWARGKGEQSFSAKVQGNYAQSDNTLKYHPHIKRFAHC